MSSSSEVKKDTQKGRYDRQERAIGKEAMQQLFNTKVLILGMGGLGVEVAKNIVLMGIRHIYLYDPNPVCYLDLCSQFFVSEQDVGKNRVECCIEKLRALNDTCNLQNANHKELNEEFIKQFTIVISTDKTLTQCIEMDEICRGNNIKFIASYVKGLYGFVFVDFGKKFEVKDLDGELPSSGVIVDIVVDPESGHAIVDTNDPDSIIQDRHNLDSDDEVLFQGIVGMEELNNSTRKIKVINGTKFDIGPLKDPNAKYAGGGYFYQQKRTGSFDFKSLKECIENPVIDYFYDFTKMDYGVKLHVAFLAHADFVDEQKRDPRPYNEEDAQKMMTYAKKRVEDLKLEKDSFDEIIVKYLSYTSMGQINPLNVFFGGIVSQEAQKASTHKFSPIHQWFYFESLSSLPWLSNHPDKAIVEEVSTLKPKNEEEFQCQDSRYDGQIVVFGKGYNRKVENLKVFVVGSGALGCEFLKNFAMMGVGCGPKGRVTVTDMDSIETSNLSRQFLFRDEHVGKMKSDVAAEQAKEMNPNLNIKSMQDKVAADTEHVFDDKFFENLSCVICALDNVEARLYVDSRCIFFKKIMIDSGTLGPKAHLQVVVPDITESYGSQRDPEIKEIPKCTVHMYPNLIQHTITWARELFNTLFSSSVSHVNSFLQNPNAFLDHAKENLHLLETVHDALIVERPKTFRDCIHFARKKFEQYFNHLIKNILLTHPLDSKTSSGAAFWSGAKRAPTELSFDPKDETHLQFIESLSRLMAFTYHIEIPDIFNSEETRMEAYGNALNDAQIPQYVPQKIKEEEDQKKEQDASSMNGTSSEEQAKLEQEKQFEEEIQNRKAYIEKLKARLLNKDLYSDLLSESDSNRLNEIEFEKDDDSNYHMDFITSSSNLRARNYKIPEEDKHKTKGIAGNIIPAMITTTALITGLVCLQMYKLVLQEQKHRCIEDYRNTFLNIATNYIGSSEPAPPKIIYGKKYNLWDRFEINEGKDITLQELMDRLNTESGCDVVALSYYGVLLFGLFMDSKVKEARLKAPVAKLIEHLAKTKLPKQKTIVLSATAVLQNEVTNLPPIHYRHQKVQTLSSGAAKKRLLSKMKK